jgi:hypothetical protein
MVRCLRRELEAAMCLQHSEACRVHDNQFVDTPVQLATSAHQTSVYTDTAKFDSEQ